MGATVFFTKAVGDTPRAAFIAARDEARYRSGAEGYTGTIAEKSEYVRIKLPEGLDPFEFANDLIDKEDPRIDSKWGPAGCIETTGTTHASDLSKKSYLFFGWASY